MKILIHLILFFSIVTVLPAFLHAHWYFPQYGVSSPISSPEGFGFVSLSFIMVSSLLTLLSVIRSSQNNASWARIATKATITMLGFFFLISAATRYNTYHWYRNILGPIPFGFKPTYGTTLSSPDGLQFIMWNIAVLGTLCFVYLAVISVQERNKRAAIKLTLSAIVGFVCASALLSNVGVTVAALVGCYLVWPRSCSRLHMRHILRLSFVYMLALTPYVYTGALYHSEAYSQRKSRTDPIECLNKAAVAYALKNGGRLPSETSTEKIIALLEPYHKVIAEAEGSQPLNLYRLQICPYAAAKNKDDTRAIKWNAQLAGRDLSGILSNQTEGHMDTNLPVLQRQEGFQLFYCEFARARYHFRYSTLNFTNVAKSIAKISFNKIPKMKTPLPPPARKRRWNASWFGQ